MRDLALNPFVTLLVIVDSLGIAPIFAAPTKGYSEKRKREAAIRGTVLGAAILLIFALAGDALLRALRISTPAFRIAGGILLFLLALDMIFASPSGSRSETVRQQEKESYQQDISVCPLATPCSPGPARSRPSSSTPASGAPRSWRCSWPYYSWFCSHLVLPLPRPLRIT